MDKTHHSRISERDPTPCSPQPTRWRMLPADTGKSKRKEAEDEAPEKKAPPLDEKVLAGRPRRAAACKEQKLRDLFCQGREK